MVRLRGFCRVSSAVVCTVKRKKYSTTLLSKSMLSSFTPNFSSLAFMVSSHSAPALFAGLLAGQWYAVLLRLGANSGPSSRPVDDCRGLRRSMNPSGLILTPASNMFRSAVTDENVVLDASLVSLTSTTVLNCAVSSPTLSMLSTFLCRPLTYPSQLRTHVGFANGICQSGPHWCVARALRPSSPAEQEQLLISVVFSLSFKSPPRAPTHLRHTSRGPALLLPTEAGILHPSPRAQHCRPARPPI
mmetsp:Transcript_5593/g.16671  ORF Transcript_5593/g.16671 Transcript_5593/m.16671 type:complete len:245 (-) Transcript_5593:184-918(-)